MDLEDYVVSGEDLVAEVVNLYPEAEEFFRELGMHCVGCGGAEVETVWAACRVHGLNPAQVLRELNRRIMGEA